MTALTLREASLVHAERDFNWTLTRAAAVVSIIIRLITRVSVRYGECNMCFILRGTPSGSFSHCQMNWPVHVQATFLHQHN